MAKILDTDSCKSQIEKLICEANDLIGLISPYIGDSGDDFNDLISLISKRKSDDVCVKLFTIMPKNQRNSQEVLRIINKLERMHNVEVYCNSNDFHAKCYFNENEVLITSMNLSNRSKLEIGVLISKEWDSSLYLNSMRLVNEICKQMGLRPTKVNELKKEVRGYCIRCKGRIPYDPNRPLCDMCYSIWSFYFNPFYVENYCHKCGKSFNVSYNMAFCVECK